MKIFSAGATGAIGKRLIPLLLEAGYQVVGTTRLIAQSIAWMYSPGPEPHAEDDPLESVRRARARSPWRASPLSSAWSLHRHAIEGVVLRYGHLYEPGTGTEARGESSSVHVDAAAAAALLAIEKGRSGIYNIAEPNPYISTKKARHELGFEASYRSGIAA